MKWLSIVGNIIGIGKDALNNRAELKKLKTAQTHSIIAAQTKAQVDRILNNTHTDNEIDLITVRDKKHSYKDEVVTYLFLVPIFVAAITPFIIAYNENNFMNLSEDVNTAYRNLGLLPTWYQIGVGFVLIDVLGFRSIARKFIEAKKLMANRKLKI